MLNWCKCAINKQPQTVQHSTAMAGKVTRKQPRKKWQNVTTVGQGHLRRSHICLAEAFRRRYVFTAQWKHGRNPRTACQEWRSNRPAALRCKLQPAILQTDLCCIQQTCSGLTKHYLQLVAVSLQRSSYQVSSIINVVIISQVLFLFYIPSGTKNSDSKSSVQPCRARNRQLQQSMTRQLLNDRVTQFFNRYSRSFWYSSFMQVFPALSSPPIYITYV